LTGAATAGGLAAGLLTIGAAAGGAGAGVGGGGGGGCRGVELPVGETALMTFGAFTRPKRTSETGVVLRTIACSTSLFDAAEMSESASAAMPDTIGAADDVPQNST
jgi:hypothetical protein